MLSGIGVSGKIVMGRVLMLEESQLKDIKKYLERIGRETIVVAPELNIKQAAELDHYPVVGFVTEKGGYNSHLAIQARKRGLTAVLGVAGCMDFICDGDMVLLDGVNGKLMIEPREETIRKYMKMQKKLEEDQNRVSGYASLETVTKDGYRLLLQGNIDDLDDVDAVMNAGGEGIGLFRTEGLFTNRDNFPTESEQYDIYVAASQRMKGKTITIRTLDAGGDHALPYVTGEEEDNPFLGCRGIRFSFRRPDVFKTQCRAILRASATGSYKILLPMLSSLQELTRAKNVIKMVMDELTEQEISFDRKIPVGVMIETPAAAVLADLFADAADFLSIGTNDLTQYTVAADRGNKMVSLLYSNYHPAVLRLVKFTIECAHRSKKPVCVCGEAAGDPLLIPLLLQYGVDELSVTPALILKVREQITNLELTHYNNLDSALANLGTIEDAQSCLEAFQSFN